MISRRPRSALELQSHAGGNAGVWFFFRHTLYSSRNSAAPFQILAGASRGSAACGRRGVNPVIPNEAGLGFTRYTIL